nr:beta-D-glucosyl crocetin beta-1,6-glucosyltransferase-like [Ipomoea batatas]
MAGSSIRRSKRLRRNASNGVEGDTDEGIQTDMLDNPPSDNFESPPVVLPTRAQPDPMQDDSDGGLGGEDVQLFPELKIRGNPKHLASPIKHFNACQKNVVLALGLGDILDFQVEAPTLLVPVTISAYRLKVLLGQMLALAQFAMKC